MPFVTDYTITEADFEAVRAAVYDHCGITLSSEKQAMVRARLTKQVRTGGYASVTDYLESPLADRNSSNFTVLIDSISPNLTSFFREGDHFDYLSRTFLPR